MSSVSGNYYASAFSPDASTSSGDDLGKDAFLMLMVAQLQYQDPLNPAEDTEFVAQLAQFTTLEYMMEINDNMSNVVAGQEQQLVIGVASLIGKEVSARGYGISVSELGISKILYASDETIVYGTANIFDASGNLVASVTLPSTAAGIHEFNWDGKYSSGSDAPQGTYTFALSATDADGNTVVTDVQVSGIVDAVSNYYGEQLLRLVDGRVVAFSEVQEIYAPIIIEDTTEEDTTEEDDTSIEDLLDTSDDDDDDDE